jgi:hypothetical protein
MMLARVYFQGESERASGRARPQTILFERVPINGVGMSENTTDSKIPTLHSASEIDADTSVTQRQRSSPSSFTHASDQR